MKWFNSALLHSLLLSALVLVPMSAFSFSSEGQTGEAKIEKAGFGVYYGGRPYYRGWYGGSRYWYGGYPRYWGGGWGYYHRPYYNYYWW